MNTVPTSTAPDNAKIPEARAASALRTTIWLIGAYAMVSVVTLVVAILLRDNADIVNVAVWIRGCFAAASGIVLTFVAIRAAGGPASAYRRVPIISTVIVVAIILLLGTFPLWMKLEQGVCELLLIAVVVIVNRRHVRARFAAR